eukprot:357752-Chlamydomonas_euryale.AAC.4
MKRRQEVNRGRRIKQLLTGTCLQPLLRAYATYKSSHRLGHKLTIEACVMRTLARAGLASFAQGRLVFRAHGHGATAISCGSGHDMEGRWCMLSDLDKPPHHLALPLYRRHFRSHRQSAGLGGRALHGRCRSHCGQLFSRGHSTIPSRHALHSRCSRHLVQKGDQGLLEGARTCGNQVGAGVLVYSRAARVKRLNQLD